MRDQYLICLFVYNGFFYPFMKIFLVYIQNLHMPFHGSETCFHSLNYAQIPVAEILQLTSMIHLPLT